GDLVVREAVIEPQKKHRAAVVRELCEGAVDDERRLASEQLRLRRIACLRVRNRRARGNDSARAHSRAPKLEGHVPRDAEEPRRPELLAERASPDELGRACERLLRRVGRERDVAEQIAKEAMNPHAVGRVEAGKDGPLVAYGLLRDMRSEEDERVSDD